MALCLHDRAGSGIANLAVGPFVYVRYHGPSGAYHGGYTDEQLDGSAIWLCEQYRAGRDVFAYFNNDIGGMAPANARRLRDQLVARLSVRA